MLIVTALINQTSANTSVNTTKPVLGQTSTNALTTNTLITKSYSATTKQSVSMDQASVDASCIMAMVQKQTSFLSVDNMQTITKQCSIATTTNSTTNTPEYYMTLPQYFNSYVLKVGGFIAAVSITASVIVILLVTKVKFLHGTTNTLLAVKAVFDILGAVSIMTGLYFVDSYVLV